jgi:cytochrome P450
MRMATRDTELRGTPIREGDRLMLLYLAANRDESVFGPDADAFRATRETSGHVAFGFGEHFCLGAALARLEARIAFTALLERFPDMQLAGEVERLPSLFIHGIVRLPIVFQ